MKPLVNQNQNAQLLECFLTVLGLDQVFQVVVHLGAHAHCLGKGRSPKKKGTKKKSGWWLCKPEPASTGPTPELVPSPFTYPVGMIMNSCMARALPAWLPPLMMLKAGTGRYCKQDTTEAVFQSNTRNHSVTHRVGQNRIWGSCIPVYIPISPYLYPYNRITVYV